MLFALPGYQFPYTVMNRCLYLTPLDSWPWRTTKLRQSFISWSHQDWFWCEYRRRWRRTVSEMAGVMSPYPHQTPSLSWDTTVCWCCYCFKVDEIRRPLRMDCRQGKRSPTSELSPLSSPTSVNAQAQIKLCLAHLPRVQWFGRPTSRATPHRHSSVAHLQLFGH
jgi:hypothetical protein